eukprot:8330981-Pyramimonas_sp.AAC.1
MEDSKKGINRLDFKEGGEEEEEEAKVKEELPPQLNNDAKAPNLVDSRFKSSKKLATNLAGVPVDQKKKRNKL